MKHSSVRVALDGLCIDNKCVDVLLNFPKTYFYAVSESYVETSVAKVIHIW